MQELIIVIASMIYLAFNRSYMYYKIRFVDMYVVIVTNICRYICLRFELKAHFTCTIFCDLYAKMVQGRQFIMFTTFLGLPTQQS